MAELLDRRAEGRRGLGAGACRACESCAAEEGETRCLKPGKQIFGLESTGVNVLELVRTRFGLELEWRGPKRPQDRACAVGAVFDPVESQTAQSADATACRRGPGAPRPSSNPALVITAGTRYPFPEAVSTERPAAPGGAQS